MKILFYPTRSGRFVRRQEQCRQLPLKRQRKSRYAQRKESHENSNKANSHACIPALITHCPTSTRKRRSSCDRKKDAPTIAPGGIVVPHVQLKWASCFPGCKTKSHCFRNEVKAVLIQLIKARKELSNQESTLPHIPLSPG